MVWTAISPFFAFPKTLYTLLHRPVVFPLSQHDLPDVGNWENKALKCMKRADNSQHDLLFHHYLVPSPSTILICFQQWKDGFYKCSFQPIIHFWRMSSKSNLSSQRLHFVIKLFNPIQTNISIIYQKLSAYKPRSCLDRYDCYDSTQWIKCVIKSIKKIICTSFKLLEHMYEKCLYH